VTLQHSVITAPIDGIVISRNVDVGQTVAASMQAPTLFVIAQDLTQMRVNASVDEADIGRITIGQPVTFRVDAYPSDTFKGIVSQVRLQPVTESNVVSYITVIDVPNPELKLKPGMTANVTVEIARADDVLKVPTAALRYRPTAETFAALKQELPRAAGRAAGDGAAGAAAGATRTGGTGTGTGRFRPAADGQQQGGRAPRAANETRVWVLADNRISPVRVQTGISDGTTVAIDEGELTEGAQVVTGAAAPANAAAAGTSPLLPQRFGRNGGQGARAGAGAGAAGARR
jgi:HlyD family secretion protein